MRLRRQHDRSRQRNFWPSRVEGLGNVLNERLRRARNQGKLHIFPILANRVIDDRPTLEKRLLAGLVGEDDSVGALPDRHLADIAHKNVTIACAGRGEAHAPHVTRARRTDQAEIAADFIVEFALGDANRRARAQFEVAHLTGVGHDRESGHIFELVFVLAARPACFLDAQQPASGSRCSVVDFDARAAQGRKVFCLRDLFAKWKPQRFQPLIERSNRVVAHR